MNNYSVILGCNWHLPTRITLIFHAMGTPSKKTWELVHSLTPVENEQFYNRAFEFTRGRYTQYLKLYEVLRSLSIFDEKELRKRLAGEKFLKHLHRVKYYLYGKILKFVRDVQVDGETEIFAYLENVKFLFRKRLYHHIPSQIEPAILLTKKTEDFQLHLRLLDYQRELVKVGKNWGIDGGNLEKITLEEDLLWEMGRERYELNKLRNTIEATSPFFPDEEKIILVETELNAREEPLTKTGKILASIIQYFISFRRQNYLNCLNETDKIIKIFLDNPGLLTSYSHLKTFVMAVYNGANLNIYHKNYGKSDELMSLIDKISDTKVREPALFYETRILHELWIGIATSDITRSENAIMELQLLPPETVERIDPVKKIEIFHSSSIASIIAGKPADALRSINLLRTSKPLYMRKDLRQYARILFLVVHYDLGNVDIVETGVKAARISFTRSKVESLYYKSILKMFSRLARSKSPEKTNAAMLDFLKGFSGKTADTWNKMNLYFNIRVWLISKLEKVTFTSALKNKEFSKTIGNDDNATSSHHNAE